MVKNSNYLWSFLLSFSILIFAGCNSDQTKNDDKNTDSINTEINTKLLQEQNDLYEKVCKDFSDINKLVLDLNDKIHTKTEKLTEAQNNAIDEIEQKRSSINTRMHELKKVSPAEWENFKLTLEEDIVDVKAQISEVISTIK